MVTSFLIGDRYLLQECVEMFGRLSTCQPNKLRLQSVFLFKRASNKQGKQLRLLVTFVDGFNTQSSPSVFPCVQHIVGFVSEARLTCGFKMLTAVSLHRNLVFTNAVPDFSQSGTGSTCFHRK